MPLMSFSLFFSVTVIIIFFFFRCCWLSSTPPPFHQTCSSSFPQPCYSQMEMGCGLEEVLGPKRERKLMRTEVGQIREECSKWPPFRSSHSIHSPFPHTHTHAHSFKTEVQIFCYLILFFFSFDIFCYPSLSISDYSEKACGVCGRKLTTT